MHCIWVNPLAINSLLGPRTRCIRERAAPSRAPSKLCSQRPGSDKDPGLFVFCFHHNGLRIGARRRSLDRAAGNGRCSLTNCCKTTSILVEGRLANLADIAQLEERGHAMAEATSSRLVIRSTSAVSFHSVPRDMVLAVRDVHHPWPGHVQRDTTSDGMLASGHSRSGITYTCRVRLVGRGHHSFKVGTRVRLPHATPEQELSSSQRFGSGNRPQRLGGAGTRDRMD